MKKIILLIATLSAVICFGCSKPKCGEDPQRDCVCPMVYDPVCGCDGVTYGNSCEAACAGVHEYTPGACSE